MTLAPFPRLVAALSLSVLLAGCGAVAGSPSIEEVSGWVDSLCTGAPTAQDISCNVHLILHNKGGKGSGYASVGVPVKTAGGATAKPVQCTMAIPAMAQGDYAETSCEVVIAKGMIVPAPPQVVTLMVGAQSDPAGDPSTLLTILAGLLVVNLLAVLWVALEARGLKRRSPDAGGPRPGAPVGLPPSPAADPSQGQRATAARQASEFDIPPMPGR